jgi:hypothetical protein
MHRSSVTPDERLVALDRRLRDNAFLLNGRLTMVSSFIPSTGKPEERAAKALEYIAGRLGSIDDTLQKLLKAAEQSKKT